MLTKIICLLSILVGGRAGGDGPSEFRKAFDGIAGGQREAREEFDATWPRLEAMKKDGARRTFYFFFMPEAESPLRGVLDRNPSREERARACSEAGKPWGVVPRGPEYAKRMADWGCTMFVLGFDIHALHAGIRAAKERYASFF